MGHETTTAPSSKIDRLGPGAHHPKWFENSAYKRTVAYGFGKQRRPMDDVNTPRERPSPHAKLDQGDYSRFNKSPKYSFGTMDRTRDSDHEPRGHRRPDPGSHNPNDLVTSRMSSMPAYSVSPRRDCQVIKKTKLPGPGSYLSEECSSSVYKEAPRAKFGCALRGVAEDTPGMARLSRVVPGPGQYAANCTRLGQVGGKSGPAWSMPGRAELDLANPNL